VNGGMLFLFDSVCIPFSAYFAEPIMIRLSAAIITFNEELNLRRCLQSLQKVADEIVVVDSLSTDATTAIAAEFGAKVVMQPFLGYIEQKNFALSQCSNNWVISLDADEALTEELAKSILQAKQSTNADAYTMSRLTSYCGQWIKHGGWYPDRKVRLFNRTKAQWAGINPHDKIELQNDAKCGMLKGDILHYTYNDLGEHIRQADKFSAIVASDLYHRGKKTSLLKIVFKPCIRFVRDFIFKSGWRDGYYGFVIAKISAHAVFLREIRLKEHHDKKS
jgi:glycosyltransferase involved in cell wall biosynthesis